MLESFKSGTVIKGMTVRGIELETPHNLATTVVFVALLISTIVIAFLHSFVTGAAHPH